MRAGDLLRQLDRRLLPLLARAVARLGDGGVRLRVLTTVALLSSLAVAVTAVWAVDRRPVVDQTTGDIARVGVVDGQSIPGYLAASRSELAALAAAAPSGPAPQTWALVTLSAYLAPARLVGVLDGVSVSEVFTRVPLPETQTQIVRIQAITIPADVVAGMTEVAGRKDREAGDYRARAAALTGSTDQDRELRRLYDSGAVVASAEAAAYRSGCSCVYAAVVRATPVVLERLAARPGVRAVDPAPEVRRLDRAVFTPPLPDQQDVVRPPVDSALPPGPTGGTPDPSAVPGAPVPSDGPVSTSPDPVDPSSTTLPPASADPGSGDPATASPTPSRAAPSVDTSDTGSPSEAGSPPEGGSQPGPTVVP